MEQKKWEKVIDILTEKVFNLETEKYLLKYECDDLKKEVARLNELLTPTKKVGDDNE